MPMDRLKNLGELAPWEAVRELEKQLRHFISERAHDAGWFTSGWEPPVDLAETEDVFILQADIPGVPKDALELTIVGNVLTIKGERLPKPDTEHDAYHLRERRNGAFQRSFELPAEFKQSQVSADFLDGVLTVTLPKRHATQPRHVRIDIT